MKEIGGYLQLEHLRGAEYHEGLLRLNLGRTALTFALTCLGVKKLYLPRFICDSVTAAAESSNAEIVWYNIGEDFLPADKIFGNANAPLPESSWLYIINYYGQFSDQTLLALKETYGNIMVDNTHSFFQRPLPGVPTLYSCRKYFGLPDGAYLYLPGDGELEDLVDLENSGAGCKAENNAGSALRSGSASAWQTLPVDTSAERMRHILGRFEHSASDYYSDMLSAARSFYDEPPKRMSLLTENLLRGIDYEEAQARREENYQTLHRLLGAANGRDFIMSKGPFVYPFYTKNAPALKKALAAEKIFVPTYWNNVISELPKDSLEWDFASHILPLPIDQRYQADDMKHVAHTLLKLIRENQGDTL